jgi:hypothetical protein
VGEQGTHAQPVHRNLDVVGLDDHAQRLTGQGPGQVRGSHRRDSIDSRVFGRLRDAKERAGVQPASEPWPGFAFFLLSRAAKLARPPQAEQVRPI